MYWSKSFAIYFKNLLPNTGSCPHKAFEGFNIKGNNIKNVVVREVIGNPVYKILTEEEIG